MKWLILPTSVRFTRHRVNLKIQKGDVYAFAIIAQEICLRGPPFCNTHYRKLDNVFYYLTNTKLNTCFYPLLQSRPNTEANSSTATPVKAGVALFYCIVFCANLQFNLCSIILCI